MLKSIILAGVASLALSFGALADTTQYTAPGGTLVAAGSTISKGVVYHDNVSGIVQGRYTVKDSAGKLHTVTGRFATVADAVGYAIGVNTAAGGYTPVNVTIQEKTLARGLKALPVGVTSIVATVTKSPMYGSARAVVVTRAPTDDAEVATVAKVSLSKGGNTGKGGGANYGHATRSGGF